MIVSLTECELERRIHGIGVGAPSTAQHAFYVLSMSQCISLVILDQYNSFLSLGITSTAPTWVTSS